MKQRIIFTLLTGTVMVSSCEKYLDKEPDNRTNIVTPDQVSQLLTSAYPKENYILFCESMSDNVEEKKPSGIGLDYIDRINSQSFRFEVVEDGPDDDDGPTAYWNSCYEAIAAANQALETIGRLPDSTQLSAQKGEALVARAYAHFMLVTLFSKVYDPTTSTTDPGIPYVTVPEKVTFVQYDRKTVSYVYEMIEKDLLEGYPLINEQIYTNAPRFHFNKRAAAAFAARFYLFKQDYQKVVDFATAALGTNPLENIRPWNTILTNMQYADLQAEYTKSTLEGNLLLQEAESVWGRFYPLLQYSFGPRVAQSIFFRPNVTSGFFTYDIYGTVQAYNIPKFNEYFVTETLNANSGIAFNTIPLMTGEEALLNRSEAYLRLNKTTEALKDINDFASKNIDEYDANTHRITASKANNFYGVSGVNGIFRAVIDFKRAFFIHEGLRWLDILRLHLPVTHQTTNGEIFQLEPDDPRKVLQLPVLTQQAGLEQNPR